MSELAERPGFRDGASVAFVYFDLGNVLATFDPSRGCRNVAQRWGCDADQVRRVVWDSGLQDRFEHGAIDPRQFTDIVHRELHLDPREVDSGELLDRLCDMFEPIDEMVEIVDSVRAAGIKLGILSNTCLAHWGWLQTRRYAALQGPFDSLILSYEHGVMKPAADIYQVATRAALGAVPTATAESILFFDDRLENVDAALAHRWQAHRFTDANAAREVLRWWGIG